MSGTTARTGQLSLGRNADPLKSSCAAAGSVIQAVTAGSRAFQVCTRTRRAQSGIRAELRGALSQRGKDRFRFRRVGDKSSREQANGEETTDGMEPAWSTPPPADKNPRARRGVGEHLPALVSVFPPSSASQESGLTPENLPLSEIWRDGQRAVLGSFGRIGLPGSVMPIGSYRSFPCVAPISSSPPAGSAHPAD